MVNKHLKRSTPMKTRTTLPLACILILLFGCSATQRIELHVQAGSYARNRVPVEVLILGEAEWAKFERLWKGDAESYQWAMINAWFNSTTVGVADLRTSLAREKRIASLEVILPRDAGEVLGLKLSTEHLDGQQRVYVIAGFRNKQAANDHVASVTTTGGGSTAFSVSPSRVEVITPETRQ